MFSVSKLQTFSKVQNFGTPSSCQFAALGVSVGLDCLRDPKWDMLPQGKAFPALLRLALKGWLKMVMGGPNCRTRSVLRHRPLGEKEWGPRPLRSWHEDQEWGRKDLTEKERQRVEEDDILMLRMIMLFVVAEEVRKVNGVKTPTQFAIEQPAVPKEEEVVSWWKTGIWKMMVKTAGPQKSHRLDGRPRDSILAWLVFTKLDLF